MSWHELVTGRATLWVGDCREALAALPPECVDAVVCDPPYEIGFMGKSWDSTGIAFDPATWAACLRVLKPGGHLISFGGTRTYHRIACAIEDAGFFIRDSIHWTFGSGFPKSLDVSKAIDASLGVEPIDLGVKKKHGDGKLQHSTSEAARLRTGGASQSGATVHSNATLPGSPEAAAWNGWNGWGTALKPSHEPAVLARKPFLGTVAENVLTHGTGALNIDACRIGDEVRVNPSAGNKPGVMSAVGMPEGVESRECVGRWPSNAVFQHSSYCLEPEEGRMDSAYQCAEGCAVLALRRMHEDAPSFFYCAKPSRRERDHGLGPEFAPATGGEMTGREDGSAGLNSPRAGAGRTGGARNTHATVKPLELMRYLCRLVTPPGGVVLDPFTGSGTTGMAAMREGFSFIGSELMPEHARIAAHRIQAAYLDSLKEKK